MHSTTMPGHHGPRPVARRATRVAVTLAVVAGCLTPALVAHAGPDLAVSSVTPGVLGAPTVAQVDVSGVGLTNDDTITDSSDPSVTFSAIADDGNGGLFATASVTGPAPATPRQDDITVMDGGGDTATCAGCLTIEAHPNAPTLTDEVPGATSVDLAWAPDDTTSHATSYEVSWTAAGGPTSIATIAPAGHTRDGAITIAGLVTGTPYTITVASHDADGTVGDALALTEAVGVAPDPPTVVGSNTHPCCESISALGLDAQTWTTPAHQHWTFTVRSVEHGATQTFRPGSNLLVTHETAERGYSVTATVANQIGTSAPSDPIIIKPVVLPGAPRGQSYRYANGVLTFQWQPPVSNGNSPIRRYHVFINGGPGTSQHRLLNTTTTATSISRRLAPGLLFEANVIAVNRAGAGPGRVPELQGATSLGVVTGLDANRRGRWRYDDRGGWHSLGGNLAQPPVAFLAARRRLLFIGADRQGHASVRSASSGWHRLSARHCYDPTATRSYLGVDIACRSSQGTLLLALRAPLHHGLPHVAKRLAQRRRGHWDDTRIHLVGAPQSSGQPGEPAWFAFRVRHFDAAGHDVEAISDAHPTHSPAVRRVRLACLGDPVTSTFEGAAVTCQTGESRLAWRSLVESGTAADGSITVPWQITGRIGAAGYDDGLTAYIATTDPAGVVHVNDAALGPTWTLGSAGTTGVAMLADRG